MFVVDVQRTLVREHPGGDKIALIGDHPDILGSGEFSSSRDGRRMIR
jgi:hypothetical protein